MSCALIDYPTCPSRHTTLYLHPDKYVIVAAARDILSTLVTTTTHHHHPAVATTQEVETAQSHVATLSGVGLAVERSFTVPGKGPTRPFFLLKASTI